MNIVTAFQNVFYLSQEDYYFINVPDYSQLLDVNLINHGNNTDTLEILVQYEENQPEWNKTIVVKVLHFANGYRPGEFKFLKTVQLADTQLISYNGSINSSTSHKLYYIFWKEILSQAELRDKKIIDIVEN